MKLLVRVIEAKNIPAMDPNGFSDPYVKLQLGKTKFRSKVVKKCLNPSWCEEFIFKVDDMKQELLICVLDEDIYSDDFVGQVKVPISQVFEAPDKSLGTAWYTLQPKTKKAKNKERGEILLTICFSQNNTLLEVPSFGYPSPARSYSPRRSEESVSSKDEKTSIQTSRGSSTPTLMGRMTRLFNGKNDEITTPRSSFEVNDAQESVHSVDLDLEPSSSVDFEEIIRNMEMRDQGGEIPNNLPGGVVLDQLYAISPRELNTLLFSPDSTFLKSHMDIQVSTDLQIEPWKFDNNSETLTRVVSYTKAPSKLIKALKAIEEQTYLKANDKAFAVLASVSTPDAPYGKTFKAEVLYCITPGPTQPDQPEPSAQLVVSWRVNFSQSTMMKGMIEGGARQGIKESFEQYEKLLSQIVKPLDLKEMGSEKDKLLASLEVEHQSDWKLAIQYFLNLTVISTVLMGLYVFVHIVLAMPSTIQGLEFVGLDLPDSIGEVIVCGLLVLQGKRVLELVSRFIQARVQKGTDHGIKASGDGWLLTVALIEGSNLAAVDSSSDPYVVFTCNGKTRTSSIKFQKSEPLWNEIFEFDATDDPPSTLDVEVFDFDGPFDEAISLGRAEINFLKYNISDLSDIWIPLQGKLAQACQSKLHLRIFLNNTRGTSDTVRDYIAKMEKEVGKKIKLRSPQTNSAFQKLFGLPSEEFLINDFSCHLKRKMPLQGRLFLSARIIGFHADLFGHKTKFFFLWEDIEDIEVIPPTLSSMGSPIIIITLRPGRGFDARHGARTQDAEGRLKFIFHSFVSFNVGHRTIMALWKARALTPEQKVQIVEEESEANDAQTTEDESVAKSADDELEPPSHQVLEEEPGSKSLRTEESGTFLGIEPVDMSIVYSTILSLPTSFFMELFRGSEIDQRVMERAGCENYSISPWESEKPDVYQRQLHYKFDKSISRYRGYVTSTQQKSRLSGKNGWLIEEFMTLHGVPLGDYYSLHLRYQVEDLPSRSVGCSVQVSFGISWLKYTRQQKKITKNIISNLQQRLKVMFSVLEKEYVSGS